MESDPRESRALDRVTAFTDAAIAIALTLLVLPLVDVAQDSAGAGVRELGSRRWGDVAGFLISFFVVAGYWRVHRRIFDRLQRLDEALLTLNTFWLLGVVFLPVPTAVLTFEGDAEPGATLLYVANLGYVAVLSLALSGWIGVHPRLQRPDAAEEIHRHVGRGIGICIVIAVVAVLSLWLGATALLFLAAIPAAKSVAERIIRRRGHAGRRGSR